jgi:hypothetical protein
LPNHNRLLSKTPKRKDDSTHTTKIHISFVTKALTAVHPEGSLVYAGSRPSQHTCNLKGVTGHLLAYLHQFLKMRVSWLLRNSVVDMIPLVTNVYAHCFRRIVRRSRLCSIHSATEPSIIRTLPYLHDHHTQRRKY